MASETHGKRFRLIISVLIKVAILSQVAALLNCTLGLKTALHTVIMTIVSQVLTHPAAITPTWIYNRFNLGVLSWQR